MAMAMAMVVLRFKLVDDESPELKNKRIQQLTINNNNPKDKMRNIKMKIASRDGCLLSLHVLNKTS